LVDMKVVTVSGTCSEVGKTGLVCELLARLPGWAAVKVTRGHYRSCGRDPETCCVSGLLGDEPRVFRDRAETAVAGKDTARYWDAGAADVRWVVGARGQEHEGLERALRELTEHPGVLVEGNRIVERLSPDLAILVARPGQKEIKASARRIVGRMDALFVPEADGENDPGALVGAPGGWSKTVWGPSDLDGIAAALRARG
jgi:molybdopterin-guanine dinucleotide biosynthesis protein